MRNKLEKDVEDKVVRWAQAWRILVLKLNLIGNTGWPDRVFLHQGRQVYIEFKRPGDDLERNQPERIEELVKQGFTVGVFDDRDSAIDFLGATLLAGNLPAGCFYCLQKKQSKCREITGALDLRSAHGGVDLARVAGHSLQGDDHKV